MAVPTTAPPKTIGSLITWTQRALETSGATNASKEALWLLAHALGLKHHELASRKEQEVLADEWVCVQSVVSRRVAHEPLQYILGSQEFCGLDFVVTPAVLIPRPETELLVQEALKEGGFTQDSVLVDVGTGSGCVAVTLASIVPGMQLFALDCSEEAVAVAKANAERHGVSDTITWMVGDLLVPLREADVVKRVDAILSNPPYIAEAVWAGLQPEVRDFEPRHALVAGSKGTEFHERLLHDSKEFLVPGGLLVMELGQGQDAQVRQAANQIGGYTGLQTVKDEAGIERILIARRAN